MEQNRKPRDKSTNLWTPYLRRRRQGKKTTFLTSGGGKTGQPLVKEWNYGALDQWILSCTEMKRPWVYMCSPSRSPLPPPSPPAPSRSSQCTRSEHLSRASSLGWWSVSPWIVYMFRCCSLGASRPRLLPQSLKDCSVDLCLFFCSACRVVIDIFLNSMYMC